MKKLSKYIIIFVSTLMLNACSNLANLSLLQGDWAIVEVYGERLDNLGIHLSLDIKSNLVSGFLGCNHISGRIDAHNHARDLDFEDIIITQALCDNSPLELRILSALEETDNYELLEAEETLRLLDDDKKLVMILQKRKAEEQATLRSSISTPLSVDKVDRSIVAIDSLEGTWRVEKVQELVPSDLPLSQAPTITFDVTNRRLAGHLSCNSFSARFELDEKEADFDPSEIDFEDIISTRMACEVMEVEHQLTWALDEAQYFYLLPDGRMAFYERKEALEPLFILAR